MIDYKEKYEQALEKLKELHKSWKSTQNRAGKEIESVFPELSENDDETIRKELIRLLNKMTDGIVENYTPIPLRDFVAWLENQGKKEYVLKSSKDEDVHKFVQYIERQAKAYELNLPNRSYDIYGFAKDILSWLENQGEQKPADRVEPKFKSGDWIVYKDDYTKEEDVLEVSNPDSKGTSLYTTDGHQKYYLKWESLKKARLWTIQDAKDGDVLAEHETIVLFKKIEGQNIRCYCTYHYLGYNPTFYVDTLQNKTPYRPATKEQRDLLFQKMKEAGYEWNAEKKELKMIKQKPAEWSEEDKKMLSAVIDMVTYCYVNQFAVDVKTSDKARNWLKSLKDKVTPQEKVEWSEEEKKKLNRIYNILGIAADEHAYSSNCRLIGDKEAIELQDFLRSITKLQPTSIEWSEEDEKMLSDITDCIIKLPVFFESIEINGENKVSSKFISEVKNWLKSFKDRVQPQPKQKWSKEDEEAMCVIKDIIRHSEKINKNIYTEDVKNKLFDWLQALPRPKQECSEESYVTFETAKLLKEKGFPVKEISFWHYEYDGKPTKDIIDKREYPYISQSLAMRWLRVKFCFFIEIRFNGSDGAYPMYDALIQNIKDNAKPIEVYHYNRYSYVEACEAAIKYCLENLV